MLTRTIMTTTKNSLIVQPHLNFDGRCEEAIELYKKALGAEVVMLARYKDAPDKCMMPSGSEQKIMHARIKVGDSVLLVSDGRCENKEKFQGIFLSITVPSDVDVDRICKALSDGGQVTMPPAKTFFSSKFGMLQDKFGVGWMVLVTPTSVK